MAPDSKIETSPSSNTGTLLHACLDLCSGDFSAADLMIGHSCFMANRLGCVNDEMQNIKDYVARINARSAFQKAITLGE